MSRELILIPKIRYEALIKKKEFQSGSDKVKNEEHPSNNEELGSMDLNKAQIKNEIEDNTRTKNINSDLNHPRKKTKKHGVVKEIEKNQNGNGKSYITMNPKKFLNRENEKGKQTIKKKWLSFPI